MSITLPKLPYEQSALSPHISSQTLSFHYGKHHKTYVDNLNNLIGDTAFLDKSLEEIIKATAGDKNNVGIFNNAAQVWNHTFYWNSLSPNGGGEPTGDLLAKINEDFGDVDAFRKEFKNAGITQFGSGWVWLVIDNCGKFKIIKTPNAELPLTKNQTPLLTLDVWEHAYYLDFQNARPSYIDVFLKNLINWDFAAENLADAWRKVAA